MPTTPNSANGEGSSRTSGAFTKRQTRFCLSSSNSLEQQGDSEKNRTSKIMKVKHEKCRWCGLLVWLVG